MTGCEAGDGFDIRFVGCLLAFFLVFIRVDWNGTGDTRDGGCMVGG